MTLRFLALETEQICSSTKSEIQGETVTGKNINECNLGQAEFKLLWDIRTKC